MLNRSLSATANTVRTCGSQISHSDNRGVNSLQIIAHLRAAAAADVGKEQKEKFAQAVESLKAAHGYGAEYGGRFFPSQ